MVAILLNFPSAGVSGFFESKTQPMIEKYMLNNLPIIKLRDNEYKLR